MYKSNVPLGGDPLEAARENAPTTKHNPAEIVMIHAITIYQSLNTAA